MTSTKSAAASKSALPGAKRPRPAVTAKKVTAKKASAGKVAPKAPASTPKKASAAKAVATPTPATAAKKHKLVRDSFTIPKAEYAVLQALKTRALSLKHAAKKSELLRAGISALNAMADAQFLAALNSVPSLKTGRPKTGT